MGVTESHIFSRHKHCFVAKQLNKTLFCRDMSKYGIFCRKLLKCALRAEKMAASALRADSTLSPTLVRTNTHYSFEYVLAFFTFKVFADKSKTLQWCLVLYLFLFSQERLFPGSKSLVVPRGKSRKRYLLFQNLHATIDSFDCSSIYLLLHLFSLF